MFIENIAQFTKVKNKDFFQRIFKITFKKPDVIAVVTLLDPVLNKFKLYLVIYYYC